MKKLFSLMVLVLLTTGCQTTNSQYYHGDYNKAVYSYFKGDDVTVLQQVDMLTQVIQQAETSNKSVAPGIHAHLGMLYFELGDGASGLRHLELEKQLFPESSHYIDFLIKTAQGA